MFNRIIAIGASLALVASPCTAADLHDFERGARNSSAAAGVYVAVPFGGQRSGKAQGGLRLSMTHDYREAAAPNAPVVKADALELRLIGEKKPAFYAGGVRLDAEQGRKANLIGPIGTIFIVAVVGAALVGGFMLARAIDDSGEE
jgi:hypothetical protein